jgi:hypothetical protein
LKSSKLPGIDQIQADLIQAADNTFCSEIHKLWNKKELVEQ